MKNQNRKERAKVSAEIKAYGYQYSILLSVFGYLGIVVLSLVLGYVYQLTLSYSIAVAVAGVVMLPFLLRNAVKRTAEQKRFSDATVYMDQMLYAFLKKPIVKDALEDTLALFPSGQMHDVLVEALTLQQNLTTDADNNRASLKLIEASYPNERIVRMHEYFCKVERIGKNYKSGVEILIKDRARWVEETCEHQLSIKKYKKRVTVAIGLVLGICGVPVYLISHIGKFNANISGNVLYSLATVVFLIVEFFIYLWADRTLSVDWLIEKGKKTYDMQEQYERAINYDAMKGFKKSVLFAFIPIAFLIFSIIQKSLIGIGISSVFVLMMLFQHSIGHKLNVNLVQKELQKQFPSWLMEIVLYLQTENVQVALIKSAPSAPDVLKIPVRKLIQELEIAPESVKPYTNFLSEFAVPEIQEAMKRFYSLSSKGIGDSEEQIMQIVERSTGMIRKAEQLKRQDTEGSMLGLMLAPQLPSIFQMIVSFYVFMMVFFSAFKGM
jgi:ABC-type multidrug transport system fused ATPase/permease subunit